MALKNFERFARLLTAENLRKDDVLRNELNDAITKGDDKAVIEIGKKHGHSFTTDDMLEYNEKYRQGAELTDEDLDNVANILSPKADTLGLVATQAVVYAVAYAVAYGVQASLVTSVVGEAAGAGIVVRDRPKSFLRTNLGQLMNATRTETKTLAVEAGIDRAFVEGIASGGIDTEAGDELAPLRDLDKIAKHFGITLDHLVNTELVPVTIFAPKATVDYYKRNPKLAEDLASQVSGYVSPTIRDIGGGRVTSWGESVASAALAGVNAVAAGVVAYSVAGPTPLPGPE